MVKNGNMWGHFFSGVNLLEHNKETFVSSGRGVRWITGDTVPLHFRNPITVLGGVREGGGVNAGQCRAGKGGERGRSPSSVQMPLPLQLPVGFVAPLLKTYLSWTITSFTKESWSLKNLI